MKTRRLVKLLLPLGQLQFALFCFSQGTFTYDQQSSNESLLGEFGANIQSLQPIGQSFTPGLTSVDFLRLRLTIGGAAGSIYVNLRENSITGNVLAASSPVSLPSGFVGFANFFFPTPTMVSPGTTYYFQPVILSGTGWFVNYHNSFGYTGGTAFFQGEPGAVFDLWFREGQYVPEPSAAVLGLLGAACLAWVRRRRNSNHETDASTKLRIPVHPPTQAQVQALADKIDEMLMFLRRI